MKGEEEVKGWLYDVKFLAKDVWLLIRGRSDDTGFKSVSRENKKGKVDAVFSEEEDDGLR